MGALRTVVEIAVHLGTATRALRKHGLPQQKVQHGTNAALQDDTQQDPEPFAHVPAGRVLADVADHQHVDSNESPPGSSEIDVHWKRAMVVGMQHEEEKILNADEGDKGEDDGPTGNEGEFFCDGERRIGIAAGHFRLISPG